MGVCEYTAPFIVCYCYCYGCCALQRKRKCFKRVTQHKTKKQIFNATSRRKKNKLSTSVTAFKHSYFFCVLQYVCVVYQQIYTFPTNILRLGCSVFVCGLYSLHLHIYLSGFCLVCLIIRRRIFSWLFYVAWIKISIVCSWQGSVPGGFGTKALPRTFLRNTKCPATPTGPQNHPQSYILLRSMLVWIKLVTIVYRVYGTIVRLWLNKAKEMKCCDPLPSAFPPGCGCVSELQSRNSSPTFEWSLHFRCLRFIARALFLSFSFSLVTGNENLLSRSKIRLLSIARSIIDRIFSSQRNGRWLSTFFHSFALCYITKNTQDIEK